MLTWKDMRKRFPSFTPAWREMAHLRNKLAAMYAGEWKYCMEYQARELFTTYWEAES